MVRQAVQVAAGRVSRTTATDSKTILKNSTDKTISIGGGLDRDGSDFEQTRRGIILLVLLFLLPVFLLLYRFSIK